MKRWIWAVAITAIVAGGAGFWWWKRAEAKQPRYRTARVERGDLVQAVRATGIVQPIRLVQVGTQVNGPIQKLLVDFNSRVKEGEVVARIDPAVYEARLAQDEASLVQAEAAVQEAQARLVQAEKELVRARELAKRELVSVAELDAAQAGRDTLAAQLRVADARVAQARATLRLSKTNLEYTVIRSPVDGVVVARNVSEGQTVVASMSAQTLFLVATDLQRMQVEASIPEADIGRIRAGQPVTFSVDAYDEEFTGTVSQVRLSAASVQNVVTYTVVIEAANPKEKLFPGMTANISCEVARRAGALKLPNAALRFRPASAAANGDGKPAASAAGGAGRRPAGSRGAGRGATVWVAGPDGAPESVSVKTGISDGSFTELLDPSPLVEGRELLTGLDGGGTASAAAPVNPFTPQMPGRGSRPMR